jgi:hypothetical protein
MERLKENSRLLRLNYVSEVDYHPDPLPAPEITPWQDADAFYEVREREMTVARDQLPYGLSDDYEPCFDRWYSRVIDSLIEEVPESSQLDVPSSLFDEEEEEEEHEDM